MSKEPVFFVSSRNYIYCALADKINTIPTDVLQIKVIL